MNALVATKAKVSRALISWRQYGALLQAKKRRGQQIDDLLMRVAGRVRGGEWLVLTHSWRSVGRTPEMLGAKSGTAGVRGLGVMIAGRGRISMHWLQEAQ